MLTEVIAQKSIECQVVRLLFQLLLICRHYGQDMVTYESVHVNQIRQKEEHISIRLQF